MNIDEMQAGGKLNCLIAEKLFDWHDASWDCECNSYTGLPPKGHGYEIVPDCSTDIAAAMEVLEKIKSQMLRIDITLNVGPHLKPYVVLVIGQDGKYWQGEAESLPLAICRAALKALGVTP